MPLKDVDNWVQHDVRNRVCIRCGKSFAYNGLIHTRRDGLTYLGLPTSKYTKCIQASS